MVTAPGIGQQKGGFLLKTICASLTTPTPTTNMTHNSTADASVTSLDDEISIRQKDALLYIIVVLGFYSLGVICLMVKYLKEEKKDIEEEILLEQFLKNKPQTPHEQRARPSGRLALDAFNAANLLIQPISPHGRVTFV